MDLIVVTPTRLFGEGLASCFSHRVEMSLRAVLPDLASLRETLKHAATELVLIDISQGVDLDEVRGIAAAHSTISLVALGLQEQQQDVIRCGRAGFRGYVPRNASIDQLCSALSDIVAGRLACSPEISSGLLRALFRIDPVASSSLEEALTCRESEVLQLIGRGLTNKEIARELTLSLATVKHHVHRVLSKLQLSRRAQAMRRVRDTPWISRSRAGN